MKAAVIYEAGGPEVLKIESRPIPTPQVGEVLIRVKAFGLNRSELFTRQGHSPGVWERAADPSRAVADRVHREVELLVLGAIVQPDDASGAGQEKYNKAMQLLEQAGADRSNDVRLRFDFGHVAERRREDERAVPVLESAVREAPDPARQRGRALRPRDRDRGQPCMT